MTGSTASAADRGGPLIDGFGRLHEDLRISVTDRCNLRCFYCMPEDGTAFTSREELLSYDEMVRVAAVTRSLGIRSVRITGGEPLVRSGVPELVASLATLGFGDLSLTTNGTRLAGLAPALAAAGLDRVNVSCDSLRPARFASIRRRGELGVVLDAMDAAEAAGLLPVKVNVVLVAGVNDDEVLDFAAFARSTGRPVRFIEYMPIDGDGHWRREQVVAGEEVVARIAAEWPLEPVPTTRGSSPAERYRFRDADGEIGVISSVTRPFCGACDRLRLTADGAIRNCLFSDDERSVRAVLRGGGSDDELAALVRRAVAAKRAGHGIGEPVFIRPRRTMSMIGG